MEIPIIMSRLPCDAQFHIAPRNMKEVWKINKLLSIIKSENNSQELSAGTRSSGSESLKPPSSNWNHAQPNVLLSTNSQFKIHCAFCGEVPYSSSCDKIINCESWKKILADEDRCFNCLCKVTDWINARLRKLVEVVANDTKNQYAIRQGCM